MRALALLLAAVLGGGVAVTKVRTGFRFVEGPAADAAGNLYFTDIPNERIHKLAKDGTLSVFVEKSGRANGLFVVGAELYACEGGRGVVAAYTLDGARRRVVAAGYEGKRFNAPNDLVPDAHGGLYFTDPKFGRDRASLPQGVRAVYYVAKDGAVSRVTGALPQPNGVTLAPGGRTLYVVMSGSEEVMAYPVAGPGRLGAGRVFYSIKQPEGRAGTGGDGLTVDARGTLYITTRLGVQVVNAKGALTGVIGIPETPSNATFRGRTLLVTARTSLYAVSLDG